MRGLSEFEAAMEQIRARTEALAAEMVNAGAMIVVARTQANFAGAHARGAGHVGGALPNIVSGDLRRSIVADPVSHDGLGVAHTEVAPRMAYGRRVELGLMGGDALGRVFHQAPHPFFAPGVDTALPEIRAKFRELAEAAMRS